MCEENYPQRLTRSLPILYHRVTMGTEICSTSQTSGVKRGRLGQTTPPGRRRQREQHVAQVGALSTGQLSADTYPSAPRPSPLQGKDGALSWGGDPSGHCTVSRGGHALAMAG